MLQFIPIGSDAAPELRVLGRLGLQPSPGPAIEGIRAWTSSCCLERVTWGGLRAAGGLRGHAESSSGSMIFVAPAIPKSGVVQGHHSWPTGRLWVARQPSRPDSSALAGLPSPQANPRAPTQVPVKAASGRR